MRMAVAPKRPALDERPATTDDASITGRRGDSDARDVQRRGSESDTALETFEQNVERGTNDARLRQDVPASPDARGSDPD
jgi:hypothetical protein